MGKLSYQIRGEARAEIFGVFPEAVLNRCGAAGLSLRGVRAVDGQTLRCTVDEKDLDALRVLAQQCQCELRLLSLRGGSRYRQILRRRIWLPITAVIMGGLLLFSSLFVWDIEICGNERVSRGEILRALREAGIDQGSFWPALSPDLACSQVLCRLPELAWLTVNVNGSRAVVLVREREEKPEIYRESEGCSLKASHTGLVRRVSVLNGRALVKPGLAVQTGETLITGNLESLIGAARPVRARGEVWADTWYEITAICPRAEQTKGGAAGRHWRFALIIGEKRINFYGKSRKTLDGYDKIMHEYNLGAEGLFSLPVSLVCETYTRRASRGPGTGDPAAMEGRLRQYLLERIEGEICSLSFSTLEKEDGVYVTLRARCFENIARINEAEAASP